MKLIHDPIAEMLAVINDLYPELKDAEVCFYYKPKECSALAFITPSIEIAVNSLADYVYQPVSLAHEAAHLVDPTRPPSHGSEWEMLFRKIWQEFCRRQPESRTRGCRTVRCLYSEKDIESNIKVSKKYDTEWAKKADPGLSKNSLRRLFHPAKFDGSHA
jgi:hypothetical protein